MVCQEEQQRLVELEGGGELHQQLVQHVQELEEDRRALVGKVCVVLSMTAAICMHMMGRLNTKKKCFKMQRYKHVLFSMNTNELTKTKRADVLFTNNESRQRSVKIASTHLGTCDRRRTTPSL